MKTRDPNSPAQKLRHATFSYIEPHITYGPYGLYFWIPYEDMTDDYGIGAFKY